MAKISVEVDTEKKSLVVTINGKKMTDAESVHISKYEYSDDDSYMRVSIDKKVEEKDGVMIMTSLIASANDSEWQEDTEGVARASLQETISNNILKS